MKRRGLILLSILAPALWNGSAPAQTQPATEPAGPVTTTTAPAKPDEREVWRKIWAFRAARAEAALRLARQIRQLPLAAEAKLGDYLSEAPQTERALLAWMAALEPAEPPDHTDDGTCRLTLEVPRAELAAVLKEIHAHHYKGEKFASADFDALSRPGDAALRQQTQAKAHPLLLEQPLIPRIPGVEYFDRAETNVKQFWEKHVTAAGRAAAEARARSDAIRRLGERIKDVVIDEKTRLADYVAGPEERGVDTRQFVRGAREKGLRYHADAPIAEVEMVVSLRTVYACLKAWALRHDPTWDVRPLERLVAAARAASIRQVGIGSPDEPQLKASDAAVLRSLALAKSVPDWVGRTLRETGRAKPSAAAGDETDAREQAARAAEWHAHTALAGRLEALPAAEQTTVGQLAGRDPARQAALLTALLDAGPVAAPAVAEDGATEVTLELPLMSLWRLVLHWQQQAPPAKD